MLRTFLYLAMAFVLAACQPAPVFRVDISMVRHRDVEVIRGVMAARGFGVQTYVETDPSLADAQVRFVNHECRYGMVVSAHRESPFLVIDEGCCARNAGIAYCVAHAMGHFLTTDLHVCHQPTASIRGEVEFCDPRQSVAGRHLMGVGAETPWRELSADEVWMTPTEADVRLMEIRPLDCRQGDDGRVRCL